LAVPFIAEVERRFMAVNGGAGTDLSDPGPRTRRPWRRRFGYSALILLLAGGVFYAALRYHWRHEFLQRVAAVHGLGYPVTLEELDAWYTWPEATENAAFWILEAAGRYREPADMNDGWDLWFLVRDPPAAPAAPLDDRLRTLLARHIAANAEPLKLLYEAPVLKECRYPADAKENLEWPHSRSVTRACVLLSVEAIHHVESSNPADGVRSLLAALAVANSLASEPVLLAQHNRVHCQSLALSALERTVNRVKLNDEQWASLSHAVAEAGWPEAWMRAMVGLRCTLVGYCEHPERLDLERPASLVVSGFRTLGLLDRGGVIFMKLMDESLAVRELPVHERMAAARALNREWQNALRTFFHVRESTSVILEDIEQELTEVAQLSVAHTALAIERYRLSHGQLPTGLDNLVPVYLPRVPQDPFDGQPLRYRRLEPGFIVYSIGPDQTDDGGKQRRPVKGNKGVQASAYDMVFMVER
jgi:hypothetical protein